MGAALGRRERAAAASAWAHKRKALNAESKLLLNARLTEEETWNEEAIDERGV